MAADMARALQHRQLIWVLARNELLRGTHLTILGPLWLIVQPLLWMLAMFFLVRPALPSQDINYQLYIAIGIILFSSVQTFIIAGSRVFVGEKERILNAALPISVYVFKNATRVALEMAVMSPLIAIAMIFFPPHFGPAMLLAIPGLAVFFVFGIGVTLTLGTLSSRFADIIYLSQAIMRVMLFVTPVFWIPDIADGARLLAATVNPLHHILLIIRDPLMGKVPALVHYQIALGTAFLALTAGIVLFARFRGRIPVWL